jgi:hypothetical protein
MSFAAGSAPFELSKIALSSTKFVFSHIGTGEIDPSDVVAPARSRVPGMESENTLLTPP